MESFVILKITISYLKYYWIELQLQFSNKCIWNPVLAERSSQCFQRHEVFTTNNISYVSLKALKIRRTTKIIGLLPYQFFATSSLSNKNPINEIINSQYIAKQLLVPWLSFTTVIFMQEICSRKVNVLWSV